jgi:urease accessory protein
MRVQAILPAGSWAAAREVDQVLIDYDGRFRRRIMLVTVAGSELMLDLPQAVRLRDGDGLAVERGVVRVRAQPEELMEIHAHGDVDLVRIAWHLGNRHLPIQVAGSRIRIRADHVIGDMVQGIGGRIRLLQAPFDPEAGAYAGGGHHHQQDEDDDHGH